MNLVKYANDYWVTLADYTDSRDIQNYSDYASVKSAVRTFVVRRDSSKYVAFRGEKQIANLIQENRDNDLFTAEVFKGHTRTALIHWDMLEDLGNRFPVRARDKDMMEEFIFSANNVIKKENLSTKNAGFVLEGDMITNRAAMLRQLRNEDARLEKEIEIRQINREKIKQAISAVESLEIETT